MKLTMVPKEDYEAMEIAVQTVLSKLRSCDISGATEWLEPVAKVLAKLRDSAPSETDLDAYIAHEQAMREEARQLLERGRQP